MDRLEIRETADGSFTFFSGQFGENFHTRYGAKKEAEITYIRGCQLLKKAQVKKCLKILDVCYGLGYNTAAALESIWSINPDCFIEIIALEIDERVYLQAIKDNLLNPWNENIVDLLTELARKKRVASDRLNAQLLLGDARVTIKQAIGSQFRADAVFLDPFSPPKCPQLWTVEFLSLVARCLNPEGIVATYSCSAAARAALQMAGLKLGANFCVGRRSPGTVASFRGSELPPLAPMEVEHLKTRAAVPFRDPRLQDSAETIKQRREREQSFSKLEPTSQWKKRWS